MYIKSNATTEYTLEINLQEDQDGNGSFDGSGAVDDEFQYEYVVEPSASGYSFVSVPLSDFADDNAVNGGGDGQLSDQIANLVFAIGGLPAETFTFTIDDIGFTDDGTALPVELASFDVRTDGNDALLSWQTLSETNNARFDVQVASGTEAPFRTVGSVSGAGTTTETQRYRFRVSALDPGVHRVRLRQVDLDGTTALLDAQTVDIGVDGPLSVVQTTANPVREGKTAGTGRTVQCARQARPRAPRRMGNARCSYDRPHSHRGSCKRQVLPPDSGPQLLSNGEHFGCTVSRGFPLYNLAPPRSVHSGVGRFFMGGHVYLGHPSGRRNVTGNDIRTLTGEPSSVPGRKRDCRITRRASLSRRGCADFVTSASCTCPCSSITNWTNTRPSIPSRHAFSGYSMRCRSESRPPMSSGCCSTTT
jgi:hypothetical protein